jgi:hypothetical protein
LSQLDINEIAIIVTFASKKIEELQGAVFMSSRYNTLLEIDHGYREDILEGMNLILHVKIEFSYL